MIDYAGFSAYMLENDLSANTRRMYLRFLRDYGVYNGDIEPDKTALMRWRDFLCGRNSPQTVNLKLTAMAKYCDFAGLDIRLHRVKVQRRTSIDRILTPEDVGRLIDGLDEDGFDRMAAIVRLLAKTGGRVSEVRRYRKADLLRGFVDMATKGKTRRIYIPEALQAELRTFAAPLGDLDFLCRNRFGGQITARGIAKGLKAAAARYGLPPESVHPHAFRHYYAVEFLRRNPDIALLADVLGHSSIETTRIYLRLTESQQKKEIDKTVNW